MGTQALFAGDNLLYGRTVVDIYNASTGQWYSTTMPADLDEPVVTTVGTKAIFAGDQQDNKADVYDIATGQWTVAALSQARDQLAATTVGNKAIFAGGTGANGSSSAADILSVTFPPEVTVSPPTDASNGTAAINYRLIDSASNLSSIVVQYSVNGGPWQTATAAAGGDGTS